MKFRLYFFSIEKKLCRRRRQEKFKDLDSEMALRPLSKSKQLPLECHFMTLNCSYLPQWLGTCKPNVGICSSDWISCSPEWSQVCYVTVYNYELLLLRLPPLKARKTVGRWLRTRVRILCTLGKHSTSRVDPQSSLAILVEKCQEADRPKYIAHLTLNHCRVIYPSGYR